MNDPDLVLKILNINDKNQLINDNLLNYPN